MNMNPDFNPLTQKVNHTLKRYSMLPEGSAVVVGFSGGADSMALLSILLELSSEYHWKIHALHVNHGIRGVEADQDEQVCSRFCEARNIPFSVLHVNIPELSSKTGEGEEECGRRVRYQYFEKMGNQLFPDIPWKIATAHNANDSVETALFHLARGTSLKGMTGIPPVRGRIIRPLITCTREEIESYCSEQGLPFVTDRTNLDNHYARNRIRNVILPEFQKINSGVLDCMIRSLQSFSQDEAYLEEETRTVLDRSRMGENYSVSPILQAPRAIAFRALAEILREFTKTAPETKHIERLYDLLSQSGTIQVPSGTSVCVQDGKIFCRRKDPEETGPFSRKGAPEVELPYGRLTTRIEKNKGPLLENILDYDKISGDFIVRNRRPGDRFRPPGRKVSKTLKSLFEEQNIPVSLRSSVTILEKDGEIAWMEGFGASEHFAADSKSQNLMMVTITRTDH